jgi:hypothetical protein
VTSARGTILELTKDQIMSITQIALFVPVADVEDLVREIARTEAFSPIFDPTWFQQNGKHIGGHLALARAFLTFRKSIAEIAEGSP